MQEKNVFTLETAHRKIHKEWNLKWLGQGGKSRNRINNYAVMNSLESTWKMAELIFFTEVKIV